MNNSWPSVSLGDLIRLERRPVKVDPEELYEEIGIYCFGRGIFRKSPRTGFEVGNKDLFLMKEGDFILQVTFAWEGAIAIVSAAEDGLYGSTRYPTFRVDESRCVPQYLLNYFRTEQGHQQLVNICPGSAGRNRVLSIRRIPEVLVPLPPFAEQRWMVAQIEELDAQIREARTLRHQASKKAEALAVSRLVTMLVSSSGDGMVQLPEGSPKVRRGVEPPAMINESAAGWSVPAGWRRISIAQLLLCGALIDVKDGNHGSNHPRSNEFVSEGLPFLMASDIQGGLVRWQQASRLGKETLARLRVGFSRASDVLFTHKASIGRTAVSDRDSVLSPQVTYYRCNSQFIEPRWLQLFLSSPLFLSQLSDIQAQSTRDFVSISKQYKQFVLLPPIAEQRRIVAEQDAFQTELDAVKRLQGETAMELNALLPSILDRAFKGEL